MCWARVVMEVIMCRVASYKGLSDFHFTCIKKYKRKIIKTSANKVGLRSIRNHEKGGRKSMNMGNGCSSR